MDSFQHFLDMYAKPVRTQTYLATLEAQGKIRFKRGLPTLAGSVHGRFIEGCSELCALEKQNLPEDEKQQQYDQLIQQMASGVAAEIYKNGILLPASKGTEADMVQNMIEIIFVPMLQSAATIEEMLQKQGQEQKYDSILLA